ncbi:hypothetical protein [Longirhabdus pacifica]|uniref:hypothetical protein n=1 Tax=Longirhabdus pacifica TaxID=2305227 RepID=UPI001008F410|nr:hypothetical protein [Longirhabdus pacifica]
MTVKRGTPGAVYLANLNSNACVTFCRNVCNLFSSGRRQCRSDCLNCTDSSAAFKKIHQNKRSKVYTRPKKKNCGCSI